MSAELKACPFCGGQAKSEETICDGSVRCQKCNAKFVCNHGRVTDDGLADAIAAWNRRTDLTPPAADYVAGLEAAMIVYRDNLWREIMGGEGCRGHPCCVSPKGEGCDCHDKFERIEKYAGDQALAARPAAPDTRVTLSQIADWFDAVANPARAQSPQHMAANYRDRLHAIINGGQDRG